MATPISYHKVLAELVTTYNHDLGARVIIDICVYRHRQHCEGYRSDYGLWPVLAEMDCKEEVAFG
jgi:hypothetical protein